MQKVEKITSSKGNKYSMITGTVRSAYQSLFTPRTNKDYPDAKPYYYVTLLFDKENEKDMEMVAKIRSVEDELLKEAGISLTNAYTKRALKDGDQPNSNDRKPFPGYFFIVAKQNSETKDGKPIAAPLIFDREGTQLKEEDGSRLKSGDYVRCAFTMSAFNTQSNKGVTAYLSGAKKYRTGDPIGGSRVSADAFGDAEEDDDVTEFDNNPLLG